MHKVFKNLSIYLLIVLVIIALIKYTSPQAGTPELLSYDQFVKAVEAGEVQRVEIQPEKGTNAIKGVLKDGSNFESSGPLDDDHLRALLLEKKVHAVYQKPAEPGWWVSLLTTMFPILLIVALFFFLMQQSQGGGNKVMSFGKSRARLHNDDKKKVTFADVAGVDEVREELQEIVEFLKNPRKFNEIGARIPKGVLLFGPPGTGKTLLAR
ncbi:ATP-dependent metallopeptidase FtsH/Yme1/Tma family protein, partial [Desulforudis sp. 1190]